MFILKRYENIPPTTLLNQRNSTSNLSLSLSLSLFD